MFIVLAASPFGSSFFASSPFGSSFFASSIFSASCLISSAPTGFSGVSTSALDPPEGAAAAAAAAASRSLFTFRKASFSASFEKYLICCVNDEFTTFKGAESLVILLLVPE